MDLAKTVFNIACHPYPQWLLKALRVVPAVNALLGIVAPTRTLPGSGMTYRLRFVDSWILSKSVFGQSEGEYYNKQFISDISNITAVVDLGCNVGFFCLWVEHLRRCAPAQSAELVGLAVDGNEAVLAEMKRNLELNGMRGIELFHGLAGGKKEGSADFIYAQSTISSSGVAERRPASMIGVTVRQVPFIDVAELWDERFGARRIDLLKIDIEGFEIDFIRANPDFMARVDRLFIEWHKPQIQVQDVRTVLGEGAWTIEILSEDSRFGVAYAWRRNSENGRVVPD